MTAKSAPKVFDISKPGKSAPSSSSKPIIVSNRPILKDPMMVDEQPEDKEDKEETSPTAISHVKIVPLTPDDDKDEAADQKDATKVEVSKKTTAPTIAELAVKVKAKKDAEDKKKGVVVG